MLSGSGRGFCRLSPEEAALNRLLAQARPCQLLGLSDARPVLPSAVTAGYTASACCFLTNAKSVSS